jgi:transketolase
MLKKWNKMEAGVTFSTFCCTAWAEAGLFPVSDLQNLRKVDSDLEGHPTPRLNFIDVGTGSLGQGVSVAAGMAYVGKYLDKASYR